MDVDDAEVVDDLGRLGYAGVVFEYGDNEGFPWVDGEGGESMIPVRVLCEMISAAREHRANEGHLE
jgi:hypothetical protein